MMKEKAWPYPIPKTVRSKKAMVDGKVFNKCPYKGCDFMLEDSNYIYSPTIDDHVKKVHEFVWLRKGKTAGWYPLSKFHPRPNEEHKEK